MFYDFMDHPNVKSIMRRVIGFILKSTAIFHAKNNLKQCYAKRVERENHTRTVVNIYNFEKLY